MWNGGCIRSPLPFLLCPQFRPLHTWIFTLTNWPELAHGTTHTGYQVGARPASPLLKYMEMPKGTKMFKILCCGDREWEDGRLITILLMVFKHAHKGDIVIVQGEARGADILSKKAAKSLQLEHRDYPARWDLYGRGAGPIRNKYQFDQEQPDLTIAFHDNIVESKGTLNMINYAVSQGCPTIVVFHGEEAILDYKWWGNKNNDVLPDELQRKGN